VGKIERKVRVVNRYNDGVLGYISVQTLAYVISFRQLALKATALFEVMNLQVTK